MRTYKGDAARRQAERFGHDPIRKPLRLFAFMPITDLAYSRPMTGRHPDRSDPLGCSIANAASSWGRVKTLRHSLQVSLALVTSATLALFSVSAQAQGKL